MKLFNLNTVGIGIDLGTSNTLVAIQGKGVVLNEPSVVAIDNLTGEFKTSGYEAKQMIGRTPKDIRAVKPLKNGVIADYVATQLMLKNIMKKVCKKYNIYKARVVVAVPSGITEVEERAVEESVLQAGASEVYLIDAPMAAAIGSTLDIAEPSGNIIVDIGGGTTEVAVVSLGGVVVSNTIRIAGDELIDDIVNYVKREFNLAIGETTAEEIKINIGSALPLVSEKVMEIRGRDLISGYPRSYTINSKQVEEAMRDSIAKIIDLVKATLEKTPPELSADISEKGILLTGGGAMIENLDKLLSQATGMPVYISELPLNAVVLGTEKTLSSDMEKIRTVMVSAKKRN